MQGALSLEDCLPRNWTRIGRPLRYSDSKMFCECLLRPSPLSWSSSDDDVRVLSVSSVSLFDASPRMYSVHLSQWRKGTGRVANSGFWKMGSSASKFRGTNV